MKRFPCIIIFLALSTVLLGCSIEKAGANKENEKFYEMIRYDNDFASIKSDDIEGLSKDMTYMEIIYVLGKTRDVGSGLHVVRYIVDGNKQLLISFVNPKDKCPLSGKELLKRITDTNPNP